MECQRLQIRPAETSVFHENSRGTKFASECLQCLHGLKACLTNMCVCVCTYVRVHVMCQRQCNIIMLQYDCAICTHNEAACKTPWGFASSFHPKAPATVKAFAQVATTTQLALHEIPAQKVSHSQKPGA